MESELTINVDESPIHTRTLGELVRTTFHYHIGQRIYHVKLCKMLQWVTHGNVFFFFVASAETELLKYSNIIHVQLKWETMFR